MVRLGEEFELWSTWAYLLYIRLLVGNWGKGGREPEKAAGKSTSAEKIHVMMVG